LPESSDLECELQAAPAAEPAVRVQQEHPDPASRGGKAIVEKYGKEYMSDLGRKGSRAVVRKYGLRFYSEIAARNKGVKKRRPAEPA